MANIRSRRVITMAEINQTLKAIQKGEAPPTGHNRGAGRAFRAVRQAVIEGRILELIKAANDFKFEQPTSVK